MSKVSKQLVLTIRDYAIKHGWTVKNWSFTTGLVSASDQFGIYKVEIYTSKMSVGLTQKGSPTKWFKKVSSARLKAMFREPLNLLDS